MGRADTPGQLVCLPQGQTRAGQMRARSIDEDESEEKSEQIVCNMAGQEWETLPFPIIINSGACACVMPTSWCNHTPIRETQGSKSGEFFRAANGLKIPSEGERLVSMMIREGTMREMSFTVCSVIQALGSVSQMCRTGHRVIFNPPWDPEGSYIEHMDAGE